MVYTLIKIQSIWWITKEEEQPELGEMGILYDDLVIIRQSETEGEPSMITVNCPDKTGLGCDLCRIFLFFGLTVARIGMCCLRIETSFGFLLKFRMHDTYTYLFCRCPV